MGFLQNKVNMFTHKKYIYSPACHHEIQGHPNKVSRKEVSKSRLWSGQAGPRLQGTVDSFAGLSILSCDTVSFNLIYICIL